LGKSLVFFRQLKHAEAPEDAPSDHYVLFELNFIHIAKACDPKIYLQFHSRKLKLDSTSTLRVIEKGHLFLRKSFALLPNFIGCILFPTSNRFITTDLRRKETENLEF
jgi:hypothetical protein